MQIRTLSHPGDLNLMTKTRLGWLEYANCPEQSVAEDQTVRRADERSYPSKTGNPLSARPPRRWDVKKRFGVKRSALSCNFLSKINFLAPHK